MTANEKSLSEHELGDETFMSAEQLRGYMKATMLSKASQEIDAMDHAGDARRELIESLSTRIAPQKVQEVTKALLRKLRIAAERGDTELMVMRFPNELCTDKGRAINNAEAGWPDTLTGRPRQAYELWRDDLRTAGYRLTATIVDWPGGFPGDVGFFLAWGDSKF